MKLSKNPIYYIGTCVKELLEETEEKFFKLTVDKMITENEKDLGIKFKAFIYNGDYYHHSNHLVKLKKANELQLCFITQLDEELAKRKSVRLDIQQIWQGLFPLCKESLTHMRNSFPEELVSCLRIFKDYKREVDQEVYLNELTAMEMKQYERILPKLHYYLAMRLVF
jgi:hypothetical protein